MFWLHAFETEPAPFWQLNTTCMTEKTRTTIHAVFLAGTACLRNVRVVTWVATTEAELVIAVIAIFVMHLRTQRRDYNRHISDPA